MEQKKHFVLVHGACHGAWCWYKLKPLLEASGHRVTVLDMAASGIHSNEILDVRSLKDYSEPLLKTLASLPPNEKVILVGHSLGGMNLALAMETYPHKISASVFLTAFAPNTTHKPSYFIDQFRAKNPMEAWLDTQFSSYGNTAEGEEPFTSMLLGTDFLAYKLYHLSPAEDLELAKTLLRPSSLFLEDLSKAEKFTDVKYGSVTKVFVICDEDKVITKEFQEWMIENNGIQNVMEITGADHMPMFSKPNKLFQCLVEIAHRYT